MPTGEHDHSTNALCPECCRQIASPHYRIISVLNDIAYPIKGFIDDATEEIGNVLTRIIGVDNRPPRESNYPEPREEAPRHRTPLSRMPQAAEARNSDTVRRTREIERFYDEAETEAEPVRNQRDVLTTPLPDPRSASEEFVLPVENPEHVANNIEDFAPTGMDHLELTKGLVEVTKRGGIGKIDLAKPEVEETMPSGVDWLEHAKSSYLKIRKSQEFDAAPPPPIEPVLTEIAQEPPEEVRMRGKVVAKRISPITSTSLMGLQFESRVQEANSPTKIDYTLLLNEKVELALAPDDKPEEKIKPRNWMAVIKASESAAATKPEQAEPIAYTANAALPVSEIAPKAEITPVSEIAPIAEIAPKIEIPPTVDVQSRTDAQPRIEIEASPDAFGHIHSWREEVEQKPYGSLVMIEPQPAKVRPARPKRGHQEHNHDGRTVCEACMSELAGTTSNPRWEDTKENVMAAGRGAFLAAKVLGIGVFGAAMAVASFFPTAVQAQTLEQQQAEEDRRLAKKKQKNEADDAAQTQWEEDRDKHYSQNKDERKAWDDSAQALWRAKRIMHVEGEQAADEEFWKAWRHRGDETAAEKKAWEDAKNDWEKEKAARFDREKATDNAHLDNRQKQWDERQKEKEVWYAAKNAWEDEKAARNERERKEKEAYLDEMDWNAQNKVVADINDMGKHGLIFERDEMAGDDSRVNEVNSLIKGVEDGKVDAGKLKKATEELQDERKKIWDADRKRSDLHSRALDLQAQARREEELAQMAYNRGDDKGADGHSRSASSLWREADGAMASYRSV